MDELPVGIVGGGIVGLAIGRELTRRFSGLKVLVFEKEERLAAHQTSHNSGVVHAGIYYKPGSLKAELCSRGRVLLREYCQSREVPYQQCGKLVVAVEADELGRLDDLERTARQNEVPGLRRIDRSAIAEVEPHAAGLAALHSPETAITDFTAVARAMAEDIRSAGGELLLSTAVTGIDRKGGAIEVRTANGVHRVRRLVACAGLQADRVDRSFGEVRGPRIIPFRGEYLTVTGSKQGLVRGMIYPVPDPRYPFLGVHFTRLVHGGLEVGPNAVLALKREGYGRVGVSARDVGSIAAWPGFWRLARTHWQTGARELRGSLSIRSYMRYASRYVPEIGRADVHRGRVGIRAQAVARDGSLVDDFEVLESDGVLSIRNAPSPAATSSLAIAEHVVDRMAMRA